MNLKLLILLLCAHTVTSDENVKDFTFPKLMHLFYEILRYKPGEVSTKDVAFYLHTRKIKGRLLPLNNKKIDKSKETKMIIHGWIDNHNRTWVRHLTDELLKKGDFNVIQVDWGPVSHTFYLSSVINLHFVGNVVAEFVLDHQIHPKKLHLVGHSLGSHISGIAGDVIRRRTGVRVRRISGMDPAGPLFRTRFMRNENKLDDQDADIVDAYHTDGLILGYYSPIGTFDVYINGGVRMQPECHLDLTKVTTAGELFEDMYCSHAMGYVQFTEIINHHKYRCRKCDHWVYHFLGLCQNNSYVFGAEDVNESMRGVCFVTTKIEK